MAPQPLFQHQDYTDPAPRTLLEDRNQGFSHVRIDHLFFFNDPATTEIYTSVHTLSLHDALPIWPASAPPDRARPAPRRRTESAGRSEEHTSELQSRTLISYAVFCLKKKKKK